MTTSLRTNPAPEPQRRKLAVTERTLARAMKLDAASMPGHLRRKAKPAAPAPLKKASPEVIAVVKACLATETEPRSTREIARLTDYTEETVRMALKTLHGMGQATRIEGYCYTWHAPREGVPLTVVSVSAKAAEYRKAGAGTGPDDLGQDAVAVLGAMTAEFETTAVIGKRCGLTAARVASIVRKLRLWRLITSFESHNHRAHALAANAHVAPVPEPPKVSYVAGQPVQRVKSGAITVSLPAMPSLGQDI